ncbi:Uncharacterised protein [Vibrio cholerae]|nr:Uncharacterised protein [Vibrio cholerae]CSB83439.1 Uncharacterised protein [Vibrio cholerae]CSC05869.1 Uncharacterised protein [Vibrio cholerae]
MPFLPFRSRRLIDTPITAGMPNARDKIAAWELAAPSRETTASSLSLGSAANTLAVSSRTTKITGLSILG